MANWWRSGMIVVALGLGGCEPEEPVDGDELRTLAGQVDADTYVALVADGDEIVLYVCDGDADSVSVAAWFEGTHVDGSFDLTSEQVEGRAVGSFADGAADGTITVGGETLSFTAEAATGPAGLYFSKAHDADAVTFWAGWVVQADGSIRGSVLNRKTNSIVAAGNATPNASVTVMGLRFDVVRLTQPRL